MNQGSKEVQAIAAADHAHRLLTGIGVPHVSSINLDQHPKLDAALREAAKHRKALTNKLHATALQCFSGEARDKQVRTICVNKYWAIIGALEAMKRHPETARKAASHVNHFSAYATA
jgi:hypothetical protein